MNGAGDVVTAAARRGGCNYGHGHAMGGCACTKYRPRGRGGVCTCGHERAWHLVDKRDPASVEDGRATARDAELRTLRARNLELERANGDVSKMLAELAPLVEESGRAHMRMMHAVGAIIGAHSFRMTGPGVASTGSVFEVFRSFLTSESPLFKGAAAAAPAAIADAPKAPSTRTSSTSPAIEWGPGRINASPAAAVDEDDDDAPRANYNVLGEAKILGILLEHQQGGVTKLELAIRAVYAHKAGGFNNVLSALRGRGLISPAREPQIEITAAGIAHANTLSAIPPTLHACELLDAWKGFASKQRVSSKAIGAILDALAFVYPNKLTARELAERTGYEHGAGGFNNALSRVRTLGIVEGKKHMKLHDAFRPSGGRVLVTYQRGGARDGLAR